MNAISPTTLNLRDEAILAALFRRALRQAGDAMFEMSGRAVAISAPEFRRCTPGEAIALAGGPDAPVVAVYVSVSGGISGHALLVLPISGALRLAARLLASLARSPEPRGADAFAELDALAQSALLELGNVTIAAALNAVGDRMGVPVHPSVPVLVTEFAGAVLDSGLVDLLAESHEVLASRTLFVEGADTFDGTLLLLPRPESLRHLLAAIQVV